MVQEWGYRSKYCQEKDILRISAERVEKAIHSAEPAFGDKMKNMDFSVEHNVSIAQNAHALWEQAQWEKECEAYYESSKPDFEEG